MTGGADISPCGLYRYRLWRGPEGERKAVFVMLNPSTADGEQDDPTIRRCLGFAKRWGCPRLEVVNLHPYRATKPRDLWAYLDGLGMRSATLVRQANNRAAREAMRRADVLVFAWGAQQPTAGRSRSWQLHAITDVDSVATGARLKTQCLGTSKAGHPRHPLFVKGDAELVPYRVKPWL